VRHIERLAREPNAWLLLFLASVVGAGLYLVMSSITF